MRSTAAACASFRSAMACTSREIIQMYDRRSMKSLIFICEVCVFILRGRERERERERDQREVLQLRHGLQGPHPMIMILPLLS